MAGEHAGTAAGGILQVHPTRRCNLACSHCYSSSSPHERGSLSAETIAGAIDDASRLGFTVVSLSGGEPLLYDGLDEIIGAADRAGSRVNIVSNGILIRSPRYQRRAGRFDVVALSLDGLPERHNKIRGSDRAYHQVEAAADELRRSGRTFGIIHTLCSESLNDLETLAAMASDWGASLLQLHPFERSGRGVDATDLTPLCEEERLDAFLVAAVLAEQYPEMSVQLDLIHRDVARHYPAAIHGSRLSEPLLPHELVVQDDGRVVPLTYGLGDRWLVCDLGRDRLATSWPSFLETRWAELRRRIRLACVHAARGRHGEVVAWHELVRRYAAAVHPYPAFARFSGREPLETLRKE